MRLVVEADGGSRGNPGPAGYGAVVKDATTGEVLREVAAGIGRATNNVAEYQGLLAGLRAAVDLEPESVEVRMDSKLVVEQMSGRWQVKHPDMRVLAREAFDALRALPAVTFTHIPRTRNSHADRLANEAMDAAARGEVWAPPADRTADLTDRAEDATRLHSDQARTAAGAADRPAAGAADRLPGWTVDRVAAGAADRTAAGAADRLPGWTEVLSPPTVTTLLRHGATPLTAEKRFSGIGDPDLSETGLAQAAAAAERFATDPAGQQPTAIVSSPLRRARRTAEVVASRLGLEVVVEERLRETDFGAWEGCTLAEVQERWPVELQAWWDSADVAPPGGESFSAVGRRVRQARDRLLTAYAGQRVLAVTHVTPIKVLVRLALDGPPSVLYRTHVDPCGITVIDWHADGAPVLRRFNDAAHLPR